MKRFRDRPTKVHAGSVKASVLMVCLSLSSTAWAQFDLETLKARGLSPDVAQQFSNSKGRFVAGRNDVMLSVNGKAKGRVTASFNKHGKLCMTPEFLNAAGLIVPEGARLESAATSQSSCDTAFLDAWPSTVVSLFPERLEVAIVTPPEAQLKVESDLREFQRGGRGAIFNYDVLSNNSNFKGGSNKFVQAFTEVGFNTGDWILRSNDVYASNNGKSTWTHMDAYGQRTFEQFESTLQAGQINLQGSLFGGASLTGVQVFPEIGLRRENRIGPTIRGIAGSPARVDVRQGGISLYSTMVPTGEFTLTDVYPRSLSQDLVVTVHEDSGAEHSFIVPAASLNIDQIGQPAGLSAGVGRLRHLGSSDGSGKPVVAAAEYGLALGKHANMTLGAMGSSDYHALGMRVDSALPGSSMLSVQTNLSNDKSEGNKGVQFLAAGSTRLPLGVALNASFLTRSDGYRDIADVGNASRQDDLSSPNGAPVDTRYRAFDRVSQQATVGLSWSHPKLGGISVNYSSSSTQQDRNFRRGMVSWSKSFDRFSLAVAVDRDMGSNVGNHGSTAYANLSFPLGRNSVNTNMQRRDDRYSYGVSTSAPINEYTGYSLAATVNDNQPSYSGSVNVTPKYTQLGATVSAHTGGNSFSLRARGGMAVHDKGITLSPHLIKDTYAIASVGDLAGVKLSTPAGSVWTDAWGRAVVPSLEAYRNGRVEVSTASLARNVDLLNGFKQIDPARGSVSKLDFEVATVRRLLLTAKTPTGKPLTKGASVLDKEGNFLTVVAGGGQIFLPDANAEKVELIVSDGVEGRCSLGFELPTNADLNALYERASGVCEPFEA
ncbi:MAG: fimbria/pilus outer membrane usher protein [Achromobacter xylosoxidans]|nr:fimbria/pilus outer membrane usher protein [Achromobacter xylosoxidans]